MGGELPDNAEVRGLRSLGEAGQLQVLVHALTKCGAHSGPFPNGGRKNRLENHSGPTMVANHGVKATEDSRRRRGVGQRPKGRREAPGKRPKFLLPRSGLLELAPRSDRRHDRSDAHDGGSFPSPPPPNGLEANGTDGYDGWLPCDLRCPGQQRDCEQRCRPWSFGRRLAGWSLPMFSESFRRCLGMGTYTRWARDMDENHLVGLLWAIGAYGSREATYKIITGQLDKHEPEIDPKNTDYARARVLLELMSNLVRPWIIDGLLMRPGTAEARRMIADMCRKSRVDQRTGSPMFSTDLRRQLELGKYTSWARDIGEERLFAVLSVVGEFGLFAHVIAEQLDRYLSEVDLRIPYARARTSLDLISEVVRGSRFTADDIRGRIKMAIRKAENSKSKSGDDWWTS